jgi:ribosomal protein S27E
MKTSDLKTEKKMGKLYDIHCPSCGAPAYYDIRKHFYNCSYCGNSVGIDKAKSEHKGFREISRKKIKESAKQFDLKKAVCTGCGAQIVFDSGEAVANCSFCGRSLVRSNFVKTDIIPEFIVPFEITEEEAKDILAGWCNKNRHKKEARAIRKKLDDLRGFYLPYELVRGPVKCSVFRIDGGSVYDCEGFVDGVFVNCSGKLDNRLLDAMEPYNLDEMQEFDFAYVAGHRVKTADISGDELIRRIDLEVGEDYKPVIRKIMETKAVGVKADSDDVLRMPVLLPVYFLSFDGYMAAVNGQTGKVSVRAYKDSKYLILPWWLKAILSTIAGTAGVALGMFIFGAERDLILAATGCLALVLVFVFFTAYIQQKEESYGLEYYRKIFTSKGGAYIREGGRLVQSKEERVKPVTKPVFYMNINGRKQEVELRFTSVLRVIRAFALMLGIVFLPVILALFINGFNFSLLNLGGSAVWFCIAVPLAPVFMIKYGRMDIYDNPWIYLIGENGKKKHYRPKRDSKEVRDNIEFIKEWFKPPLLWLTLVLLLLFGTMVYLTAFGFID